MKKIGGRTVTCLGTMSNEETMDILATYINKIFPDIISFCDRII